jgi:hypothetical protein
VTTEPTRAGAGARRGLAALVPLALIASAAAPPAALAQTATDRDASAERSNDDDGRSSNRRGDQGERPSGGSSGSDVADRDVDTDLRARRHVRRGEVVSFSGRLAGGEAGRPVLVEAQGRGGGWRTVGRATTRSGGRFTVSWRPPGTGRFRVRARPAGEALAARGGLIDVEDVNVYRPSHASWYGPGFYGRRTACGRTIRPSTLGVAHKRLPCGTLVTFRYGSRTVTVPVIDRGPYVGGREWDLTAATRRALGFPSTGTIWSTR